MNFYAIFLTWDWIFCQLMASQAFMLKLPRSRARWMQGFNHYKVENPTPSDSQELNPISPYDPWALCPDWLIRFWLSCTETHVSSGSRPWSLYSFLHEDPKIPGICRQFQSRGSADCLVFGEPNSQQAVVDLAATTVINLWSSEVCSDCFISEAPHWAGVTLSSPSYRSKSQLKRGLVLYTWSQWGIGKCLELKSPPQSFCLLL